MTIARCRQVNVDTTPYYHVIGRCVRRAFLCGLDLASGKDFEHRRQWIIEPELRLSRIAPGWTALTSSMKIEM